MPKAVPENLVGRQFGRLTVLEYVGPDSHRSIVWRCRCQCGVEKVVIGSMLKHGTTKSCGCLQRDTAAKKCRDASTTHGKSKTPEYVAWTGMKNRCYNPDATGYERYGGIGATVCERWLHSFESFLGDMGPKPTPKHSIDRFPDSKGQYGPTNCRWATVSEQNMNRCSVRRVTFRGETKPAAEWAAIMGLSRKTVSARLLKGWSVDRTLTTPTDCPRWPAKHK